MTCPLDWLRRHELPSLIGLLLLLAGVWAFAELADEVQEGETRSFDERVLLALREPGDPQDPLGPKWVEELGRDATALGGVGVMVTVTAAAAGWYVITRRRRTALFLVGAVLGGWLLSHFLKLGFDRPRPDLVPHGSHVLTQSFPSGHAMLSAVTWFTLGLLATRGLARTGPRLYVLGLAVGTALVVGVSRVYLGVHWPTDVLAGWVLGFAWALACWLAARELQRRGRVERPAESG